MENSHGSRCTVEYESSLHKKIPMGKLRAVAAAIPREIDFTE